MNYKDNWQESETLNLKLQKGNKITFMKKKG